MKDGFIKVAAAVPAVQLGDCAENARICADMAVLAAGSGVRLLVFPELCLTGVTLGDLFRQDCLLDGAREALRSYLTRTAGVDLLSVVGLPLVSGNRLYNTAAVCFDGHLLGLVPKTRLTSSAAADDRRIFAEAPKENFMYEFDGNFVPFGTKQLFVCPSVPALSVGVEIGQDADGLCPPSAALASEGATVILNPSSVTESAGEERFRRTRLMSHSARLQAACVSVSCGEGESTTDVVYAGRAWIAENGRILAERPPFLEAGLLMSDIDVRYLNGERRRSGNALTERSGTYTENEFSLTPCETKLTRPVPRNPFVPDDPGERAIRCGQILHIQAHGLKRRVEAAHAKKLVVGISGGLDSCLALLVMACTMDLMHRPHSDLIAVTMPCFGTTGRTKSNAEVLCEQLGTDFRTVNISSAVNSHFTDIGHDPAVQDVVYENAQARERTQILMDLANQEGGLVVGTGDLSELALGFATYNGDQMSMYGVNGDIPKTLVRELVRFASGEARKRGNPVLADVLTDILETPVSPELLPSDPGGNITQKTEDLVGPYELHDFYLYYFLRCGFAPGKLFRLARQAFPEELYDNQTLTKWLSVLMGRFFRQQFKRSCLPDGPAVGSVTLSPRGGFRMPSDVSADLWIREAERLCQEYGNEHPAW